MGLLFRIRRIHYQRAFCRFNVLLQKNYFRMVTYLRTTFASNSHTIVRQHHSPTPNHRPEVFVVYNEVAFLGCLSLARWQHQHCMTNMINAIQFCMRLYATRDFPPKDIRQDDPLGFVLMLYIGTAQKCERKTNTQKKLTFALCQATM